MPQISRKLMLAILVPAIILGSVVVWLAVSYNSALKHKNDSLTTLKTEAETAQENSNDAILANVSKDFTLPDETPSFATVNDVTKLQGQDFFKNAQNGDKVIIFQKSQRAMLYRPSTKKVVEYGPVTFKGPNP